MKILLCLFTLIFSSSQAYARVFDFSMESLAPYFSVRGGTSSIGKAPYEWQTPDSYSGGEFNLNYGGGFGVSWRGESFSVQLGVLAQTLNKVDGAKGLNASGAELFSVTSEGLSYGGLIAFSYQFKKMKTNFWRFTLGGGYQYSKIENSYTATAAGQTAGLSTSIETLKGQQPFAMASIGTEFLLSGTTTISLDLGYHYSLSPSWTYGEGGSNFSGAHSQGGSVLLEDGTENNFNWNYPYLEITFRFYIDKIR